MVVGGGVNEGEQLLDARRLFQFVTPFEHFGVRSLEAAEEQAFQLLTRPPLIVGLLELGADSAQLFSKGEAPRETAPCALRPRR